MELLALALVWPLIVLSVGFVFISSSDISGILLLPVVLIFFIFAFALRDRLAVGSATSEMEDVGRIRRGAVAFSIALLLPMFVRFLLVVSGSNNLPVMIIGLIFGFGAIIWGMFIKGNKVLAYANTIGGGLAIIYLYFQLWSLGSLAQVVATAFGLVVAIVVSIVKFREKLV